MITHTGLLWRWTSANGPAAWFFITIDGPAGEELSATAIMRKLETGRQRGFGSVKVGVTIGGSEWRTSVFPQKDAAGWLLPIKKAIRTAENLTEGDQVKVSLTL